MKKGKQYFPLFVAMKKGAILLMKKRNLPLVNSNNDCGLVGLG